MNSSFFHKLMPTETKFFPLLTELANTFLATSYMLAESVVSTNYEERSEIYKRIKEAEKKGDIVFAKIFDELNTTFITPFDREDIHNLAEKLESCIDYVNSCGKRLVLYKPNRIPKEMVTLTNLIKEDAECLCKAVDELDVLKKSAKKVNGFCNELHDIENKADDLYEHFIMDYFENEKDPIELIKIKEIMHEMEGTTDAAEHVGKIIRTIIVKYA